MTKNYLLLLALCIFSSVNSQIINIPDANFKAKLLSIDRFSNKAKNKFGDYTAVDLNGNNEIEVSEAENLIYLDVSPGGSLNYIANLEGIAYFKNLVTLNCSYNNIATLDVRDLKVLMNLYCSNNKLTSINLSGLLQLQDLDVAFNNFQNLDLSNLKGLKVVSCYKNKLTSINLMGCSELFKINVELNELASLDLSTISKLDRLECASNKLVSLNFDNSPIISYLSCENNMLSTLSLGELKKLQSLKCDNNTPLKTIFMKNGNMGGSLTFSSCPNLEYICVDQNNILRIQNLLKQYNYTKCNVNSYCSFVPGEAFYTVQGKNKIDVFNDGCDALDPFVSNLKYSISNGTLTDYLFSDNSGNYNITVQAGTYTITPLLENSEYFTVSPASLKLTIPLATNIDSRDFCISLKNPKPDLEITMLPLDVARPGFYTKYKIIYKNKGNIPQSGEISLSYDDAILDVISAVPQISSEKTNTLSWKFENLKPLEMKEILVDMNLNSPTETPPVNNNDILKLKAVISSEQIDITPDDNYFALNQIVVGAVDPNDKTCLEGNIIKPELIGEYVHYLIRFENIGTYYAENIVVKDMIDLSKFDISTLVPTSSSHSYIIKISEGNKVEFIFEKIKLPFDDAHNDGYIAFKIKTLPTLKVGDTFENEANIYFDYNFPILTNKASSTFKNLGTQDFEFSQYFNIYPNPVKDILNINSKVEVEKQAMSVYDMLGQLIIAIPHAENVSKIDVSKLQTGNYILKVKTNSGTSAVKFIKD